MPDRSDLFRIEHPIIQAPRAGGSDTPALVAAVGNAGGMGSISSSTGQMKRVKQ
jgi:nitronate monooxygenase